MKRINLDVLKDKKCVKVGELNVKVIQILQLNILPCNIVLWNDRLAHIELHKNEFKSEKSFINHIELIPEIIENPDYIGKHPTKNSIEFIRRFNELIIVAVRIKNTGSLAVRTVYILSENQLKNYIINKSVFIYPK